MYWSYEHISKKFLPEIKNVWTMKELVEQTATLGDEVYLIDAVSGENYTYEQSNILSNKIAHSIIDLGLRKGDRVGLFMSNKPDFIFTLFATGKVGLVEVPINLSLREPEITHMVNNAKISSIIVESNVKFLEVLSRVSERTSVLKNVIVQGNMVDIPNMRARVISLDEMVENSDDSNPQVQVDESDDYCIFFTSGTTGLPKGAPISNKTFLLAAQSVCACPGITRESRNYTCLPLFHANAQLYSMTAMRCLGASLVLSDRFSPKKFWKEIIDYEATYFNSIGGMMQILDTAFKPEDVPNHTAKFVMVGGTPVDLWDRFEKKFKVEIFECYSMSEVPVLFGNIHPDKNMRKTGSFGKPIFIDFGRRTKVVDDDNNELEVGTGESVQLGKDFVTKGYWSAPEANKEAFDSKGWFHSGDLVRIDEDGYYHFVDRKKFMIRVAGENVSAFEVEDVVNAYPAIAQSAVVPVPDPLREEEIKAFVKLKEGVDKIEYGDFIKFCAERLAFFKVPRYIEAIEEFPKTATERVKKVEMKKMEKEKKDHGWDRNKEIPDWKERYSVS